MLLKSTIGTQINNSIEEGYIMHIRFHLLMTIVMTFLIVVCTAEDKRTKGTILWNSETAIGGSITGPEPTHYTLGTEFSLNKNRMWIDEWTVDGSFAIDGVSTNDTILTKASGSVRYAFSILKKFYNFYLVPADHNSSLQLDLSIVPTVGIGFWVFDIPDRMQLMGEIGGGYRWSYYSIENDGAGKETEPVGRARGVFRATLFKKIAISTDITYVPALLELSHFTLENENEISVPVTKSFSFATGLNIQYDAVLDDENAKKDNFYYRHTIKGTWRFVSKREPDSNTIERD